MAAGLNCRAAIRGVNASRNDFSRSQGRVMTQQGGATREDGTELVRKALFPNLRPLDPEAAKSVRADLAEAAERGLRPRGCCAEWRRRRRSRDFVAAAGDLSPFFCASMLPAAAGDSRAAVRHGT